MVLRKLLGIETSSPLFSVAMCEGEKILSFLQAEGKGPPSLLLTEMIRRATAEANVSLETLDGFSVSAGPGSFTGLRVGVMTVKTLAWALKKPVVPVSSLEVAARNLKGQKRQVILFVDARKDKVYSALFACDGSGGIRRLSPDRLLSPEEALRQRNDQPVMIVGDGVRRYGDLLSSGSGVSAEISDPSLWVPRADEVCLAAQIHWETGRMDDPHRLVPQYLYSKESDVTG